MPRKLNKVVSVAQVKAAMKKYGNYAKAARVLGVSRYQIEQRLGVPGNGKTELSPKTVEQFKDLYSVEQHVNQILEQLGDGWEYELTIARMAGIALAALPAIRAKYAAHVVELKTDRRRRVWAGKPETAKIMRGMQ